MFYLATLFDKNYLSRGMELYQSLSNNLSGFRLFVLCLDDVAYMYLSNNHPDITPIRLEELEDFEPKLISVKTQRNKAEYIFTLSPVFTSLYIRKNIQMLIPLQTFRC